MRIDNGYIPIDEDRIEWCRSCRLEVPYGACDDTGRCPICAELHRLEVA